MTSAKPAAPTIPVGVIKTTYEAHAVDYDAYAVRLKDGRQRTSGSEELKPPVQGARHTLSQHSFDCEDSRVRLFSALPLQRHS